MKQFFLTFAAVLLGGFVLLMIPFIIISAIATASMSKSSTEVEPGTVLKIDLSEAITDRDTDTPANRVRGYISGEDGTSHGINTLREKLDMAAEDENVCAIMLTGSGVGADFANMRDIRRAIQEFKEASQKPVYYFGTAITSGVEYVASAADSIFVAPSGSVLLMGCTTGKLYFKRLGEKYGIGFDVIKHGKYKSAVEPYFRDSMSDEDREQSLRFLSVIWGEMRDSIASGRGIKPETIDSYVDELKGVSCEAKAAVEAGLIDGEAYYDQFEDKLRRAAGLKADEEVKIASIFDYKEGDDQPDLGLSKSKEKVAIVYAEGQIYDGKGSGDDANIYGDDLAKTLRSLRKDKDVKAVVMRVNSPGGSALASDIIWREVALLKQEKPVVVSMGGYAASGGYYISCAASHIVAEANTLTGSIGVFGMVPNVAKLADNAGISYDYVSTSKNPLVSTFTPLSQPVMAALTNSIETTYKRFVSRVSEGRDLPFATVDSLGGGRVWTGADAVANGLVDKLGNLDDAIYMAVEEAGLSDDYVTEDYPKLDDSMTAVMKQLGLSVRAGVGKALLGKEYEQAERFKDMMGNSPEGFAWAICDMEVH